MTEPYVLVALALVGFGAAVGAALSLLIKLLHRQPTIDELIDQGVANTLQIAAMLPEPNHEGGGVE